MSWPTRTASDALSGDGVETFGQDLYDRDTIAASFGWTWTTVPPTGVGLTTSLVDEFNAIFTMPSWTVEGAIITLTYQAKTTIAGDGNFRLRGREEGGSWVNGSTVAQAVTTSFAPYEVSLTVPASPSWASVKVELGFQGQEPGAGSWTVALWGVAGNLRVVAP